ncbi:MAG: T9SS type A sorting domain-containing protein [Muribaculaceae bacterium]
MTKKISALLMFVSLTMSIAFAQSGTLKVQGHERCDIDKNKLSRNATIKAEDLSFNFDDIKFWVGTGAKRAALVIDWFDGKGETLVWGYRFDGDATGYDMVEAVAKADSRFLFLTHSTNLGNTIAGLGYDINNSGNQYLIFNGDTTNPKYPKLGIVTTDTYNYDDWTSPDAADHWRSGWNYGYWSYQVKESQAESFYYSGLGATSRILSDGSWDGWGYQEMDNPSMDGAVPNAPYVAAEPPISHSGISDTETNKVSIYPNPFADYIIVNSNITSMATITNLSGTTVATVEISEGTNSINTSYLSPGLYLIKCNETVTKIVKK